MPVLFAVTLFVSAALLFWVQPLFARMLLPLLGGTPTVWNGSMVFFQSILLAGYLWAHLSTGRLGARRHALAHLAVAALGLAFLPVAVAGGEPPTSAGPLPWLMATMLLSVGLPAFAVSGTAPLLQRWFVSTGHREGSDPYFLYAASNAGSLAGLLAYPVLLEPNLTLAGQARAWTAGYAALLLLVGGCGVALWRSRASTDAPAPAVAPSPVPRADRLRWIALAFVPSSLLLGVTTHLSTNVAAVPLFWIVPLALYLATYVLAFARRQVVPRRLVLALQPVLASGAILAVAVNYQNPGISFPLHLAALFVTALVCHGELAARRPDPAHLTAFYLWISVGGVLGGLLNTFAAPPLFRSVEEYPLVLAAACFLRPAGSAASGRRPGTLGRLLPLLPAALLVLALFAPPGHLVGTDVPGTPQRIALALALAAGVCFVRNPVRLGAATLAVTILALAAGSGGSVIFAERNAFGVVKVRTGAMGLNVLVNGTTVHGAQSNLPGQARVPLTYYRKDGPLGEIMAARGDRLAGKTIAVIGLGAGTIAAYGEAGQRIDFYEINPVVERVARDPRCFTFLADSPASTRVILGDGRLQLAKAPDRSCALIVLDAFSSDSVPVHLLTREALAVYLAKLESGGAIAVHITNRHVDLLPVLADLAADRGLQLLHKTDEGIEGAGSAGTGSSWAMLVANLADAGAMYDYDGWEWSGGESTGRVWTDDYADLLRVLRFR